MTVAYFRIGASEKFFPRVPLKRLTNHKGDIAAVAVVGGVDDLQH